MDKIEQKATGLAGENQDAIDKYKNKGVKSMEDYAQKKIVKAVGGKEFSNDVVTKYRQNMEEGKDGEDENGKKRPNLDFNKTDKEWAQDYNQTIRAAFPKFAEGYDIAMQKADDTGMDKYIDQAGNFTKQKAEEYEVRERAKQAAQNTAITAGETFTTANATNAGRYAGEKSEEYQLQEKAKEAGKFAAEKSDQYHLKEKAYDMGIAIANTAEDYILKKKGVQGAQKVGEKVIENNVIEKTIDAGKQTQDAMSKLKIDAKAAKEKYDDIGGKAMVKEKVDEANLKAKQKTDEANQFLKGKSNDLFSKAQGLLKKD